MRTLLPFEIILKQYKLPPYITSENLNSFLYKSLIQEGGLFTHENSVIVRLETIESSPFMFLSHEEESFFIDLTLKGWKLVLKDREIFIRIVEKITPRAIFLNSIYGKRILFQKEWPIGYTFSEDVIKSETDKKTIKIGSVLRVQYMGRQGERGQNKKAGSFFNIGVKRPFLGIL
jgi:hypothetical protein